MIITINGNIGSGKSSVAKHLAKKFHYQLLDIGHLRRKEAKRRGLTLAQFNAWSEKHPDAGDRAFDRAIVQTARRKRNIVVSSRTAFHFLPESFKVFLWVSEREGARRTLKNQKERRNEVIAGSSLASLVRQHRQRIRSDTRRYKKLYGLNIFSRRNYDLFLNTTHLPLAKVVHRVKQAFFTWQKTKR